MFKITTREKVAFIIIVLVFIAFVIFKWASSPQISGATQYKGINAECSINQSDKDCNEGLICVPFNEESGNGKCQSIATPTAKPTCTPKVSSTPQPTESPEPSQTPDSTPTPTDQPSQGGSGVSDGRSDGLGCASHPCYDGTKVYVAPSAPPATGRGE